MKLGTLIFELIKHKQKYEAKYGFDPIIYAVDEFDGILLCKAIKKRDGIATAEKPYMRIRDRKILKAIGQAW
jgi:hypothetical protein